MGLVVPEIESSSIKTPADQRGYGVIGTSTYINEAARSYEPLMETIIEAAEIETTMKRLLDEIEKTKAGTPWSTRSFPSQESAAFIQLRPRRWRGEHLPPQASQKTAAAEAGREGPDEEFEKKAGRRGVMPVSSVHRLAMLVLDTC
jgi:hypothetical protein